MPTFNHIWQRFLLTSSLLVGLAIGAGATVFGYSNLGTVDLRFSVFHLDGVPVWMVAVVPVALTLVAGTLYHWVDGLHHFTEHMRHRRRVHELETEVATLRSRLDKVLEMPDQKITVLPAKRRGAVSLPAADEEMAGLGSTEPAPVPDTQVTDTSEIAEAVKANGGSADAKGKSKGKKRATLPPDTMAADSEVETEPAPEPAA